MEATSLNFKQWKYRNFWTLMWEYHASGLSFDDWDQFCLDRYQADQQEVMLS